MNFEDRKIRIGWFKSKSMGTWHVAIKDWEGELCSCAGYLFNRKCWHVDTINMKSFDDRQVVDMPVVKIDELLLKHKEYKSSLEALNKLFNGMAYSTSEIFALYGLPNIGKTLLGTQEAFWFANQGVNVLYIDTEGSFITALKTWKDRFMKRFQKKGEIYAVSYLNLEDLMRFLGYNIDINLRGNKVEVSSDLIKGNSEFEEFIKNNNIGFVVLDSVSAPIRNKFPSAQQNFPARADITSMIYAGLLRAQAYGVVILTIHHATLNPANPYEIHAEVRGGIVVQYYSKRIVYMDMREKKGMEHIRRFWLVRSPNARSWSRVEFARVDGELGFIDEENKSEYLTDAEKKNIEENLVKDLIDDERDDIRSRKRRI